MHILLLPLASAIAPPAMQMMGDENPPGYPVIRAHLEIPATVRDFHTHEDLLDYERSVVAWRQNQQSSLQAASRKLDEFMKSLMTRQKLVSPSFLQGIPGLDIFQKMGESFGSGFAGGLPAQGNVGPFPVLNFQVEEVQKKDEEVRVIGVSNSSALQAMLRKEKMEARMWQNYAQMSLLEGLPVNYMEDDPLPNTHFEIGLESPPIAKGEYVPDLIIPTSSDIQLTVNRANTLAQLLKLSAVVEGLSRMMR